MSPMKNLLNWRGKLYRLQTELDKLRKLGVIEDVPGDQCDGDSKFVDFTIVFD